MTIDSDITGTLTTYPGTGDGVAIVRTKMEASAFATGGSSGATIFTDNFDGRAEELDASANWSLLWGAADFFPANPEASVADGVATLVISTAGSHPRAAFSYDGPCAADQSIEADVIVPEQPALHYNRGTLGVRCSSDGKGYYCIVSDSGNIRLLKRTDTDGNHSATPPPDLGRYQVENFSGSIRLRLEAVGRDITVYGPDGKVLIGYTDKSTTDFYADGKPTIGGEGRYSGYSVSFDNVSVYFVANSLPEFASDNPIALTATDMNGIYGTTITNTVAAAGFPDHFELFNAPPGMSIDATTGQITWAVPSQPVDQAVSVYGRSAQRVDYATFRAVSLPVGASPAVEITVKLPHEMEGSTKNIRNLPMNPDFWAGLPFLAEVQPKGFPCQIGSNDFWGHEPWWQKLAVKWTLTTPAGNTYTQWNNDDLPAEYRDRLTGFNWSFFRHTTPDLVGDYIITCEVTEVTSLSNGTVEHVTATDSYTLTVTNTEADVIPASQRVYVDAQVGGDTTWLDAQTSNPAQQAQVITDIRDKVEALEANGPVAVIFRSGVEHGNTGMSGGAQNWLSGWTRNLIVLRSETPLDLTPPTVPSVRISNTSAYLAVQSLIIHAGQEVESGEAVSPWSELGSTFCVGPVSVLMMRGLLCRNHENIFLRADKEGGVVRTICGEDVYRRKGLDDFAEYGFYFNNAELYLSGTSSITSANYIDTAPMRHPILFRCGGAARVGIEGAALYSRHGWNGPNAPQPPMRYSANQNIWPQVNDAGLQVSRCVLSGGMSLAEIGPTGSHINRGPSAIRARFRHIIGISGHATSSLCQRNGGADVSAASVLIACAANGNFGEGLYETFPGSYSGPLMVPAGIEVGEPFIGQQITFVSYKDAAVPFDSGGVYSYVMGNNAVFLPNATAPTITEQQSIGGYVDATLDTTETIDLPIASVSQTVSVGGVEQPDDNIDPAELLWGVPIDWADVPALDTTVEPSNFYPYDLLCRDLRGETTATLKVGAMPPTTSNVTATGGTVTDISGYRVHTFTTDGTLTVSGGSVDLEYLVVGGGGGGGGGNLAGGGGGGGVLKFVSGEVNNTGSGVMTLSPGDYTVTVGSGGIAGDFSAVPFPETGGAGGSSSFNGLAAPGGGGGGDSYDDGADGASGGGGGRAQGVGGAATGSPALGHAGGTVIGGALAGGGGGGAGGAAPDVSTNDGGAGGAGITSSITGSATGYAGGAGGSGGFGDGSQGIGQDGGGDGSWFNGGPGTPGTDGTGGGGGQEQPGGSGVVIIRYPIGS